MHIKAGDMTQFDIFQAFVEYPVNSELVHPMDMYSYNAEIVFLHIFFISFKWSNLIIYLF